MFRAPTVTEEKIAEAERLRSSGWSIPRIAKHFGIATSTAQTWVNGNVGLVRGSKESQPPSRSEIVREMEAAKRARMAAEVRAALAQPLMA